MTTRADLCKYAIRWSIPADEAGQRQHVLIGTCVYQRFPGIFAYMVAGDLNAIGLQADGTWSKYGHNFGTPEAAYDALMKAEPAWGFVRPQTILDEFKKEPDETSG